MATLGNRERKGGALSLHPLSRWKKKKQRNKLNQLTAPRCVSASERGVEEQQ